MIPKIIHYCWFGNAEKSELVKNCIESWKQVLPDYEIIEWNETNFDIHKNTFVTEAYKNKKWAFVSDYVRAYALHEFGGIYLDTDLEIKMSLDCFLQHGAFSGFETIGYPFTALWGSEKEHIWAKKVVEYYDQSQFSTTTNTIIVTDILEKEFGVNRLKDELQLLAHNIAIYPSTYFCLDLSKNYATHHFNGSWTQNISKHKIEIHRSYFLKQYEATIETNIVQDLLDNHDIGLKKTFKIVVINIKNKFIKKIKKKFKPKKS